MSEGKGLVISDLSACEPRSGVSRDLRKETWRAVKYEADGLKGTMLLAWGESRVPRLTYRPNLTGWHAIHVGIASAGAEQNLTALQLSGDAHPVRFTCPPAARGGIVESLWKCADMSGQSVEVGHPEGGIPYASCVTHFRFVPLTAAEVAEIRKDRGRMDTKRLFATHDIHAVFYLKNPRSADDFVEELESYRHTDVGRLLLEYVADVEDPRRPATCTGYLTPTVFPRDGDRNITESLKRFFAGRIGFYPQMVEYARGMGIPVSLSTRMNAFVAEPPWDTEFTLPFWSENPDCRCRDIDGSEIARMSYAFPKVQDAMIGLFKRMLDCGADGVHMLFNRGLPCVLYEEPLVDDFTKETGKDPRKLGEEDPAWLAFRAQWFTDHFIRRLRKELDDHARKLGRAGRPCISAHALANERTNIFYALDPAGWAREGLVDAVVGYPRAMSSPSLLSDDHVGVDMEYYTRAVKGTGAKAYIEIMPRQLEPEEYRKRAMGIYEKGADGICMWDTYNRVWLPHQWTMASRLGHKDELPGWYDGEGKLFRRLVFRSMGGLKVDKYRPSWGL